MLKIILSGLTFVGLLTMLLGTAAKPASALPVMHPQTSQAVNYWHRHWHHWHHHHHGGLTIHL